MTNLKKIGVLGGMGPAATVLLMQRVIALTEARDDVDHVPLLVDMNPQIPSRIAALIDDGGISPVPTLVEMTRNLESQGATALAMPCNTAHHYAPEITDAATVPFFNMIKLTAEKISKAVGPDSKIGMLASPATDRFNIFQNVFDEYGLKAVFPENDGAVLSVIKRIKSDGISPDLADDLSGFAKELEIDGVDCLLVGCSEFSMLTNTISSALSVFDSVDILAGAMVEFSGATRLRA